MEGKVNGIYDILYTSAMGVEIYRLLLSFLIILATLVLRKMFDRYLGRKLRIWAERTSFKYDDLLVDALLPPVSTAILLSGLITAIFQIGLPVEPYDLRGFVFNTFRIALSVIATWLFYRLGDFLSEILKDVFGKADEDLAEHFAPLARQALRILVVVFGAVLIIQNLGYSVSSLLAGLGIGGLAVALAAQDTIANFFGTIVMFTDKPFKVGDWVQFRNVDGDVESIGLRSTRIRTWSKSLVTVPNKLLTSEIIENWSAMPKRRVKMTIGVTYDSPPEKVSALVEEIKKILRDDEGVNQEYSLVYFTDFGQSSLDLFIYYFSTSTVWAEYLTVRQRVNLAIMDAVERLGLSFAFPSTTVYFGGSEAFDASGVNPPLPELKSPDRPPKEFLREPQRPAGEGV